MNELISLLALQENIPEQGLQELVFNDWKHLVKPLDDSVMQSLASKCKALTTSTTDRNPI